MLQIAASLAADILGNKHQVITLGGGNLLEALDDAAEIGMQDTRAGRLDKQHANHPRPFGCQRTRVSIRHITKFIGCVQDFTARLLTDVGVSVKHLGYRGRRKAGKLRDIVDRNQHLISSAPVQASGSYQDSQAIVAAGLPEVNRILQSA
ncbi:hypothetical protein D3C81_1078440 [compost metagenome]